MANQAKTPCCSGRWMKIKDGQTIEHDGIVWEAEETYGLGNWAGFFDGWWIKLTQSSRGGEIDEPTVWNWKIFHVEFDHEIELYGGLHDLKQSMSASLRFVKEFGPLMCFSETEDACGCSGVGNG